MEDFSGKSVSIKCKRGLGVFQGAIVKAEVEAITINCVFHNGIKMKNPEAEVTIEASEIDNIQLLQKVDPVQAIRSNEAPTRAVPMTQPKPVSTQQKTESPLTFKKASPTAFTNKKASTNQKNTSKPIPIRQDLSTSSSTTLSTSVPHSMKLDVNNQQKKFTKRDKRSKNFYLMQPDDFSDQGDFDFESNNALFDKIGSNQEVKPDVVPTGRKTEEKYRHDENIIDLMMQFKNVQLEFKPKQEYTTDEPYVLIPSIPQSLRNRIQSLAVEHGHSMERQNDFLARGACELAIQLLGGSRRFSPKNSHQWPCVTIICDEPYNSKQSEIGLSCGRQLASHGSHVMVYVKTSTSHTDKQSKELELYTASGNDFTGNVKDLPPSDLVILSVTNMNQNSQIIRYIQENRAPVMAIDPPATGINPGEINIRNAVLPILPIDDIHNTCGKLHLVNLCLSDKFYKDAGIRYFPVFGSKFMIPLHLKS